MLFFDGLFLICLLFGLLTVYAMVTDNPYVFSSPLSITIVMLAAGSWFVGGFILLVSLVILCLGMFLQGVALALIVVAILKLNWHTQPRIVTNNNKPLTVSTVNVLVTNKTKGQNIGNELAQADPDIIFIQEYDANIGEGMEIFLNKYTYCFIAEVGEEGLNDLAIFSKYQLHDSRVNYVNNRPILFAEIEHEGQTVTLANIHTMSPTDSKRATVWQHELEYFRTLFNVNTPLIVAGDFNATVSHAPFRNLMRACRLTDMTSWNNTWSSHSFLPDYLHLDHVLASVDFILTEKPSKTLGEGSDHAPVTVKIAFV